jgi:hypothetical protein
MKNLSVKIVCFVFLFWTTASLLVKNESHAVSVHSSQKEQKIALKAFIKKSDKISKFVSSNQSILFVNNYPNSPSGKAYSYMSTKLLNSKINVVKTDSLVTPFIGYLTIKYKAQDNKQCGDIDKDHGYSTYSQAFVYKGKCLTESDYLIRETKLVFAYQDDKWIFKDAIQVTNDGVFVEGEFPDLILANAFGYSGSRLKENSAWEKLID